MTISEKYELLKRDYKLLYSIAELSDCIPIEEEFWTLMENPNEKTAARLYRNAIILWFNEHGHGDSRAMVIAERWGIE